MKNDELKNDELNYIGYLGDESKISNGKLTVKSHLKICGKVTIDIECKGRLVIAATGHVQGDIKAKELLLFGTIEGSVWVENKMSIMDSAILTGYVSAEILKVDENAFCQFTMNIDEDAGQRYRNAELRSEVSTTINGFHGSKGNGINRGGLKLIDSINNTSTKKGPGKSKSTPTDYNEAVNNQTIPGDDKYLEEISKGFTSGHFW